MNGSRGGMLKDDSGALWQAAITLFGERGWMSRLAEHLGVDRSSVFRWFAGLPVPGPAAVEAWPLLYKLRCEAR
jgi:hypothetical protein